LEALAYCCALLPDAGIAFAATRRDRAEDNLAFGGIFSQGSEYVDKAEDQSSRLALPWQQSHPLTSLFPRKRARFGQSRVSDDNAIDAGCPYSSADASDLFF